MRWEYHRLSVDGPNVENALHELGQNGWELVAVLPETRIFFGFQCFFKRPLADSPAPAAERVGDTKRLASSVSVRPNALGLNRQDADSPENLTRMTWKRGAR